MAITNEQKNYIVENYCIIPASVLAKELKLSTRKVYDFMYRYRHSACKTAKKPKKKKMLRRKRAFIPNSNPPTYTTEMLVCRYDFEGMEKDEIAEILGRSTDWIDKILRKCRADGNYMRHNLYGRIV